MVEKDYSLNSGERQAATSLEDIRVDHRNRYAFGLEAIETPGYGLDVFCGNGYGSRLIAMAGHNVLAIDGSQEAIDLARTHYQTPEILFCHKLWPFSLPQAAFDFAFCLESIEHVADSEAFLRDMLKFLKPGATLVISTPNEDLMPFDPKQHIFHFRHFTQQGIFSLLAAHGLDIVKWGGQIVYDITADGRHIQLTGDAPILLNTPGQFLTICCRKL